jgi:UDP-3-O-[3-hydroxymyristoyl] glucosamine N-acyltransferase
MAGGTTYTLGELAEALQATLDGDPARRVRGVATLEAAGPDDISFVTTRRYHDAARRSRAGAFLAPPDVTGLPAPVLRCAAPREALARLLTLFHPPVAPPAGVDPTAIVSREARVDATASIGPLAIVEAGATLGPRVQVHAGAYVGPGVVVGDDSVLHPHVVVRGGARLGRRVVLHAGAVIGADGFGYVQDGGVHRKIPQVGGVLIEDDVEIGANTTIDRAMLGDTVVRRGTKIDNLVQIAHNVEIGQDCIIAAQVGIAGTSRIGDRVILLGQVGVADHVTIGDGAMLAAQSGVTHDVAAGEKMSGSWARPIAQTRRLWILQAELPEIVRRLREMERRLTALEKEPRGGD